MCYPTGGVSWVYNDHDSGFTFRSCLTDLLPQFCHVNGPVLAFIQVITDLKVCVGVCMQKCCSPHTHHLQNLYGVLGTRLVLSTNSSTHRVCTQLCNGSRVQWVLGYRYDDTGRFLVTHAGKQKCLYSIATSIHQVDVLPVTRDTITVGYELCNMFPDDGYATRVGIGAWRRRGDKEIVGGEELGSLTHTCT